MKNTRLCSRSSESAESPARGLGRAVEQFVCVRRADEGGLELRGREGDALFEHGVEELAVALAGGRGGRGPVFDFRVVEEGREHRADAVGDRLNARLARTLRHRST